MAPFLYTPYMMKSAFATIFLLALLLVSCAESKEGKGLDADDLAHDLLEVPSNTVDKSALHYDNKVSLWTLNDQLYSGYSVSFYPDSTLKEKVGILNGKKEGPSTRWYADGHLKQVADYHKGKLHGEKKMWHSDTSHLLVSHLNYQSGKPHGEQKKWYSTGELHKKLNMNMGREEGIQQAFRENGALYANYEAKEGRIFGLRKSSLCYGLESEDVQYEK